MDYSIEKNKSNLKFRSYDDKRTRYDNSFFRKINSAVLILGCSGSGKTSVIISLLKQKKPAYFKYYKHILILSKTAAVDDKIAKLKLDPANIYNQYAHLDIILEFCINNQDSRKLLIVDDMLADMKNSKNDLLTNMVLTREHLKLSIWIVTQSLNGIPVSIRQNLDALIMCKVIDRDFPLINTWFNSLGISLTDFKKLYNDIKRKNEFIPLIILINNLDDNKIYQGFDKILLLRGAG